MHLHRDHPCHPQTTAPIKSEWAITPTTLTLVTPPPTYYMIVGTNIQKGAQRAIMMDKTCRAIEPLFSYGEKFCYYDSNVRFPHTWGCRPHGPHEPERLREKLPTDILLFATRQDAEEFIEQKLKKEHRWEFQPDHNAWVVMQVVPTYTAVMNGFKIVTEQD